MRISLLSLTIIASLMLLSIKTMDALQRKQELPEAIIIGTVSAASEAAEDELEGDDIEEEFAEEVSELTPEEVEAIRKREQAMSFTETELEILSNLAERRRQLEAWQEDLEVKQNILEISQTKIDEKLDELRTLKAEVETILAAYNQKEDEKTMTLVKIYQSMKPKAAARIFSELDLDTMLRVVAKMREKSVAAILAEMDPQLARDLTETFAERGTLSKPLQN